MKAQKDRHLEAPGEANRDKHINFLAAKNGDVDPADEEFEDDLEEEENNISDDEDAVVNNDLYKTDAGDTAEVDNGFFTDDDNRLQTKEEDENYKSHQPASNEKYHL